MASKASISRTKVVVRVLIISSRLDALFFSAVKRNMVCYGPFVSIFGLHALISEYIVVTYQPALKVS